jgi:hypothetical protein
MTILLLTYNKICVAQNLITNGSFENFLLPCPTVAPNGALALVLSWKPANVIPALGSAPSVDLYCGGPNYWACSPGPVSNIGSDGIAYLGLHTRIYTPAYNESIYQILSSSLIAGNSYFISFDLMSCQSGVLTQGPSDFCVYLNIDTIIPACPTDNPTVVNIGCVPFDSISNINWKHHSFNFIAPSNSNIIAFSGAACNVTEVYYYLDNINLTSNPSTAINEIKTNEEYKCTLFPNPFSIWTTFHTDKILKDATLTVYNLYGQEVKQIKNISGQSSTFYRDNLSNGLYFFQLTQDNKIVMTNKLVITD